MISVRDPAGAGTEPVIDEPVINACDAGISGKRVGAGGPGRPVIPDRERTETMDADAKSALREELRQVEADLAELRGTVAELRQQIGESWDSPGDAADHAAMMSAADEQEALAAQLEARRERLLRRLGE